MSEKKPDSADTPLGKAYIIPVAASENTPLLKICRNEKSLDIEVHGDLCMNVPLAADVLAESIWQMSVAHEAKSGQPAALIMALIMASLMMHLDRLVKNNNRPEIVEPTIQ